MSMVMQLLSSQEFEQDCLFWSDNTGLCMACTCNKSATQLVEQINATQCLHGCHCTVAMGCITAVIAYSYV